MTNDFDILTVRRDLIAMREKHGAETPIGHRCSNLIELLQNRQARGGVSFDLLKNIERQMVDLTALNAEIQGTP